MKPEKKIVTIIEEGTEHQWPKDDITYPDRQGQNIARPHHH